MSDIFTHYFPSITELQHRLCPRWRISTRFSGDTRVAQHRALLRVLFVAWKQRLDTAVLVGNLAEEHRGGYRRQLKRLANRLGEGMSLIDALEQTPDVLDDDTVLAIRFATQCGTIEPTLERLVDQRDDTENRLQLGLRQSMIYGAAITAIAALILVFLMTFITPVMEELNSEILDESPDPRLPWAFRSLVATCEYLVNYAHVVVVVAVALGILLFAGPIRRYLRRVVASRWVGSIARVRSARLMSLLADSLEAGRPIAGSLSTLGRYHFDSSVRQKLLLARNEVEQGTPPWASLADANLITDAESIAIEKMNTQPDRVWTLRHLAAWKSEQVGRSREKRSQLVQPAVVLLLAAIVLWIGFSYFQFLTHLIESLAKP
ncbi:type II secretion system F family protein [Novipirellula artificiosorum]|uniref:Putative type II secretion system protein F n=1 Tax=Novipirellula artificiosorum TaxID=2528016 RepID=A0A5C6DA31_9BACT|nr:type II secretion system F family protein [Novipirellula artificiosorum]TWU32985.1 putative type II secretion system protein F [Novipirellula artificiosorum]